MDPRLAQKQQQQLLQSSAIKREHDMKLSAPTTDNGTMENMDFENSNSNNRILLAEERDMDDDDDDDNNANNNYNHQEDEELQDAPLPMMTTNDGISTRTEDGVVVTTTTTTTTTSAAAAAAASMSAAQQLLLQHQQLHRNKLLQPLLVFDRIIMPSPYTQHNTGTSRFRTAFGRIVQDSYHDIEAWQAVMTEASACDSAIFDKSSMDNYTKLDWVESCYGALLYRFPYSTTHIIGLAELLLQQVIAISKVTTTTQSMNSSMTNTSRHPLHMSSMKQRAILCHTKLLHLFHVYLDTDLTVNDVTYARNPRSIPMCAWVVDLWLVYIRMVHHDASTLAATTTMMTTTSPDQPQRNLRDAVTAAYDIAVTAAGDAYNNHLLWKSYLEFVQSWTTLPSQQQLSSSVSNIDHALVQRQMVQLRSVYQRAVTNPMTGLDTLWQEYENFEKQQSEALASALTQEYSPKYQQARSVYLERIRVLNNGDVQRGRLATPPFSNEDDDDYHNKLLDEYKLLRLWKTKCSYERTNPGRLTSVELAKRIRSTFTEMACTLTRHPETWHMWSTWELVQHGSSNTSTTVTKNNSTTTIDTTMDSQLSPSATKAAIVLQLGQEHIPDSTLLAYSEAQIYETHHKEPKTCCSVLEKFLLRSPNTLGFVLYQQLIRRYEGKESARAIFTRARRILTNTVTLSLKKSKEEAPNEKGKIDAETMETTVVTNDDDLGKLKMVTNRLDPSIGTISPDAAASSKVNGSSKSIKNTAGPITWHLYAGHATVEHRQNNAPDIAARVYELGLRKHATFLTVPPYIQRYAQLLLELNDSMNLRALLTRAVAACEVENKQDALASIWDMTLHFESLGGTGTSSIASLQAIEKKRREALFGPEYEDVANGGVVGVGESILIGPQKSSIAEQLIRDEGYEVCSRIVSGLSRTVDVFNVMGLWGSGSTEARSRRSTTSKDNQFEFSGGQSDASFQKRLMFEKMTHAGISPEIALAETGVGSKITARERLAGPGGGAGGGTAIMLANQQSPDWLRSLLLLLPASHSRLPMVPKPPPHLTEMALSTLRQNELPTERPPDDRVKGAKRLISMNDGGNSSDEDDAGAKSSGYGNAFRVRQRARMIENGTNRL